MYDHWDIRFLKLAEHISTWSKDPSTKVGAVIVDSNCIVKGIGYNGFPRGVRDLEERYNDREKKYKLVVHAELNAILNSKEIPDFCSIYIFPTIMVPACCPECAKAIIQAGIYRIVQWDGETAERWKESVSYSELMFREAGVDVVKIPYDPK